MLERGWSILLSIADDDRWDASVVLAIEPTIVKEFLNIDSPVVALQLALQWVMEQDAAADAASDR